MPGLTAITVYTPACHTETTLSNSLKCDTTMRLRVVGFFFSFVCFSCVITKERVDWRIGGDVNQTADFTPSPQLVCTPAEAIALAPFHTTTRGEKVSRNASRRQTHLVTLASLRSCEMTSRGLIQLPLSLTPPSPLFLIATLSDLLPWAAFRLCGQSL